MERLLHINDIQIEILFNILQFAGNKTLLITVCKYWKIIIDRFTNTNKINPTKYAIHCVKRGYLDECKWVAPFMIITLDKNIHSQSLICDEAAKNDNLKILKILHTQYSKVA